MADISLTASMRSNLLSLQGTANLMDKTQERLASGKKVNSAIDSPSSYYTARSLNNRAGDLNSLLDSMGQGISTLKAANEGIETITSFVEQAKAVANSARDQSSPVAKSTGEYTATPAKTAYDFTLDNVDIPFSSDKKGNALKGELQTYLRAATTATPPGMGYTDAVVTYDATTGSLKVDKLGDGTKTAVIENAYSYKIEISGKTDPVYVDASSASSLATVKDAIVTALTGLKDDAGNDIENISVDINDDNKTLTVTSTGSYEVTFSGSDKGITLNGTTGNTTRADYMRQFNELLHQLTDVARDSGYKGVNLLQKDDLTITFNEDRSSSLTIKGVDASADGLKLEEAVYWGTNEGIDETLLQIDNAINSLRAMASEFGNNYSIVETREGFTTSLINVLEEGSDKLTLADMNEESANMLALQTRQQLAINSLSLASQASQSVLKLFS